MKRKRHRKKNTRHTETVEKNWIAVAILIGAVLICLFCMGALIQFFDKGRSIEKESQTETAETMQETEEATATGELETEIEQTGIEETGIEVTETDTFAAEQEETVENEKPEDEDSEEELYVSFIDVGQGDAALLQNGSDVVLIDTGSGESKTDMVKVLKEKGIKKIQYLIFSHGHEDHVGQGYDILREFPIEHVICDFGNQEGYIQRLEEGLKEMNIDVIEPEGGESFTCGSMRIDILVNGNKEEIMQQEGEETSRINNQSIAVKVIHGENSFLFYGDGEAEYEHWMMKNKIDVKADVLKAPHHGGSTSSTESILDKCNPSFIVISSAPRGEFGFPSGETLSQYAMRQITTFSTNQLGTIQAVSDGKRIVWNCERKR